MDWGENDEAFRQLVGTARTSLRSLTRIDCGIETVVSQIFFEGADFVWCTAGAFRFEFSEREPLVLKEGEFLVTFPRRFVTIKGLAEKSSLHGGVLVGKLQDEFLLRLGFWDCYQCRAPYSPENMAQLQKLLASREANTSAAGKDATELSILQYVAFMLQSVLATQMTGRNGIFLQATQRINEGFLSGQASVKELPHALGCSPTHLNAIFKEHGYRGPGDYLSHLLCWRGCQLLKYTNLSIAQIADICGYSNGASFARFIQGWLGLSPTAIRNGATYRLRPLNGFDPRP